jgi:phosphopantothenate-cysteine ligase
LHSHKFEVVFVSKKLTGEQQATNTEEDHFEAQWLRIDIKDKQSVPGFPVKEIEEDIVHELVRRHTEWIGPKE